jgi:hypothetical protein
MSKCNGWLVDAAWGLAVELWPSDTRIMVKETVRERNGLKRKIDDQEEAMEEEGHHLKRQKGPEKGRGDEGMQDNQHTGKISGLANPLVGDCQDMAMTKNPCRGDLDNDLTRKAWFDFDKPSSDTMTHRMSEILQAEHGLQSKPSKALLDSMRAHGKVMAFVDKQEVSNQEDWKSWVHDNRATSETPPQKRPRFAKLAEALGRASVAFAELAVSYDKVYKIQLKKMEEEKAKEGGGEKDGRL